MNYRGPFLWDGTSWIIEHCTIFYHFFFFKNQTFNGFTNAVNQAENNRHFSTEADYAYVILGPWLFSFVYIINILPWHIWVWFLLHCCCTLRWALDCRWQPLSEAVYLNPVASSLMDFVYPVPGIYKIHQWACYWIEILGIAQCAIAQISAVKAIQWLLWSVSSSIHVKG